jgi:sulfate ABC transporter permease protein CysW
MTPRHRITDPGAFFAAAAAVALVVLFLMLPLAEVYSEAFSQGLAAVWQAIIDPDALGALKLTLMIAAIVVPINTIGGLAAAWCIARFDFTGRSLLTTLIELPLSVSPVISGLVWVLLFGAQGWLGPFLAAHGILIVFAFPGLVLATLFVTFPLVARQLLPVMQEIGLDEEEAAITLGATGFGVWWNVTLPNLRWRCCKGYCCATPAPWANSAPSRWCPATSPASPTPCRCRSRPCSTASRPRPPSLWPPCYPCWPCSPWAPAP